MAIQGIAQPELIPIDGTLRLRRFDGKYDFALEWYLDTHTVYLVDGVKKPYTPEKLERMYRYLDSVGELYFIEAFQDGQYVPIGDVTFWQADMPIVIGRKEYRGRKIGRKVISALIRRGRELGYSRLYVNEIYDYNEASKRCFLSAGFVPYTKNDGTTGYVLELAAGDHN